MDLPQGLTDALRSSERAVVLTGAGISAESGIPTFRDAQTGLWAQYRPEELATPYAFQKNPELVWEWYAWRRKLVRQAKPNLGHFALAELGTFFREFTLITQNVDSLHQRAGSQEVIELHGNITRIKCAPEGHIIPEWENLPGTPPRCPICNGMLRPDVVWFGENLPGEALHRAISSASQCQIFFSIGTSSTVEPAASLAHLALENGATVIEINPMPTKLTPSAHFFLPSPAGVILPLIIEALSKTG